MAGDRKNCVTRHPHGAQILQEYLDKKINGKTAAQKLGTTPANFSQYLLNHNLRPSRADRAPPRAPSPEEQARGRLSELDALTITLDGMTNLELVGAVSYRQVLLRLLTLANRQNLEPSDFVKIANTIFKFMEYQFKNEVPNVQRPEETISLDQDTMDQLVKRLGSYCEHCPYRRAFDKKKTGEQSKHRLESRQSPLMGRSGHRARDL